jgi:Uma2 family endonuclease
MSAVPHIQKKLYTPDEYLALERKAEFKSEYYQGEIFRMAGGSFSHSAVASNIIAALRNTLKGMSCRPLNSDMRFYIPVNGLFTYPDISLVCGQPEIRFGDCLVNPILLIEVLSDSTARYDRNEKFRLYQSITSFQEYLLVASDYVGVEQWRKDVYGHWLQVQTLDNAEIVELSTIDCSLSIADIYDDVDFNVHFNA